MDISFDNLNITDLNIIKIYSDNNNFNGHGLFLDGFILTAQHVVNECNNIFINNKKYINIIDIDEYDISVLKDINDNRTINNFIKIFKNILNKTIKISNMLEKTNNICSINNDLNDILKYKKICSTNIKTNLYPQILIYEYENPDINRNFEGMSGSIIYYKNKLMSLLIGGRDNNIIALPIDIIYNILYYYVKNNMKLYYCPFIIKNNIVQYNYNFLIKDDIILKINNIEIDNDIIYDNKFKIKMLYSTFIIINGLNNIHIEYCRNTKKGKIIKKNSMYLNELNNNILFMNYKIKDSENIKFKDMIFSELSEEFLINCIHNNINIPNIDYNLIYRQTKYIYLRYINKSKYSDILKIPDNIYILNKISGRKIKNISDIQKFNKYNLITIELIDPFNNTIKIKV